MLKIIVVPIIVYCKGIDKTSTKGSIIYGMEFITATNIRFAQSQFLLMLEILDMILFFVDIALIDPLKTFRDALLQHNEGIVTIFLSD